MLLLVTLCYLLLKVNNLTYSKNISIQMSHWRHQVTEGAEFWISCKRPASLSKFSHLQLIQNLAPSVTWRHQSDLRIVWTSIYISFQFLYLCGTWHKLFLFWKTMIKTSISNWWIPKKAGKSLSANFDEAAKLCKASDYYILGGYIANLARSSKRKGSRRWHFWP